MGADIPTPIPLPSGNPYFDGPTDVLTADLFSSAILIVGLFVIVFLAVLAALRVARVGKYGEIGRRDSDRV
ncbi:hypothetical protein AB0M95_31260 [Sphaerisporangium sp. NPDC051017]|uniref:hypothetical protein n=1 Tax=Sphaerisporangium sp. NPDC051017 TaxID=3154636 RepID=UPI003436FFF3